MDMTQDLQSLLHYNAWANRELLAKLSLLDPQLHQSALADALLRAGHIAVVADIFRAHLLGTAHAYASDAFEGDLSLRRISDMSAALDDWYLDYLSTVSEQALRETIGFRFTDGDDGLMSRAEMILHVVLHGSYHRGEIGTRLTQIGAAIPWDTYAVHLHRFDPARRARSRSATA